MAWPCLKASAFNRVLKKQKNLASPMFRANGSSSSSTNQYNACTSLTFLSGISLLVGVVKTKCKAREKAHATLLRCSLRASPHSPCGCWDVSDSSSFSRRQDGPHEGKGDFGQREEKSIAACKSNPKIAHYAHRWSIIRLAEELPEAVTTGRRWLTLKPRREVCDP